MLKKKNSMTLGKTNFIQDHSHRYRNHGNEIWQWGRESRLNSKYNVGTGEFLAKELGGGSVDRTLPRRHIRGKRGIWVNQPNRLLVKGWQSSQTSPGRDLGTWGTWGTMRNLNRFFLFFYIYYFLYLFIFRERERGRRQRGRETPMCKRSMDWLPLTHPQLGAWMTTQVCALTGNRTDDPSICGMMLSQDEGREFLPHWLSSILSKTGFYEGIYR